MIESFSLTCVTALTWSSRRRAENKLGNVKFSGKPQISVVVMDIHDNKAEKTLKFKILRETTSIVVMDTHDNKAVYLEQPGFSFIK